MFGEGGSSIPEPKARSALIHIQFLFHSFGRTITKRASEIKSIWALTCRKLLDRLTSTHNVILCLTETERTARYKIRGITCRLSKVTSLSSYACDPSFIKRLFASLRFERYKIFLKFPEFITRVFPYFVKQNSPAYSQLTFQEYSSVHNLKFINNLSR